MAIVGAIILFLLILTMLVLVHELGHFLAARLFGVRVEEFGIGFPPRARSIVRNGTRYSLNWLPLGGFVKLKGEDGGPTHDTDSFAAKPVWQRLVILAAGVSMNAILAIALFTVSFTFGMPVDIERSVPAGANIRDEKIIMTAVLPHSPAARAGVMPGDILVSIDGRSFATIQDVQDFMRTKERSFIAVTLARAGTRVLIRAAPEMLGETKRVGMGVQLAHVGVVSYPLPEAFIRGVGTTGEMVIAIVTLLGSALRSLAFESFVGPVGIAHATATVAKLGFSYLVMLIAQLSISLAVFNFLPLPALDGGRALFIVFERVLGRALSPKIENAMHAAGFVILIALLALVTIRDVARLFPS